MEKNLSRKVQKSNDFSELYDRVMGIAERYELNHEVLNILTGRHKKTPDSSKDQALVDELNKLCTIMQKLNEYGAQKNLDPYTIKSAELLAVRKAAIREFDKLVRDIKARSKQLGNAAGVPSCATAQERDARWLREVPRIMKKDKCSESSAIQQLDQKDRSSGLQVPKDPKRAYYRAKKAKKSNV